MLDSICTNFLYNFYGEINWKSFVMKGTHHSRVIVSKSLGNVSNVADSSTSESLMQQTLLSFSSNLNI